MQTLGDQISSAIQTLADIWSTIIHTLKGQWDQIQGDSWARQEKRHRFLRDWDHQELFFQRSDQSLQWRYSPSLWLFVHTQLITP